MATPFRRILVPHDLSPTATYAVRLAAGLAERHGGQVTVLHVLTPFNWGPAYPTEEELALPSPAQIVRERAKHLEQLLRDALGPRARLVKCRAVLGEAVPAILQAAKRADVIVMTTLGRTGLAHLLIGSVAEKIVRHSSIPVLTVRAPHPARAKKRGSRDPAR